MIELIVFFLVLLAAGGAVVLIAGLVIGGIIAACVGIILATFAILGLIGKVLFLPLAAVFWVFSHPLLILLAVALMVVVGRDRRRVAYYGR